MGPDDYESSAELRAVERPDRGAVGPNDSTAKLQADALADGNTRKSHGGSRIFADAAAIITAEFQADKGADAGTVGPTHTAADAPPDPESLSGTVE